MTSPPRVRFAPSPTGQLHIGGARTALFNWAYARGRGGTFVLRIEDTDFERSKPEYERAILDGLRWLGLDWDEGPDVGGPCGPYRQSERVERHQSQALELERRGLAYRCFCSSERLEALRAEQAAARARVAYDRHCAELAPAEVQRRRAAGEPSVLRYRVPSGRTHIQDAVRGEVVFDHAEVDDWIMLRSGDLPTYNFVVVVDDIDMRISHVIRGEEHLINTPKQALLYAAFGAPTPEFAHLPLMLGTDGKKLSKRTGDTALEDYRKEGYPPAAVVNFLCLQGWALDGSREIFSTDELVAQFDLKDISKGGAIFDLDKFRWLAAEYLRREGPAELARHCAPYVVARGLASASELAARQPWFERVVSCEKERIHTYAELAPRVEWLFRSDRELVFDPQALAAARKFPAAPSTLTDFAGWLEAQGSRSAEELRAAAKEWVTQRGLKMPALFQPLRLVLTGQPGGLDLFEAIELLGRAPSLLRIRAGAERLASPISSA